MRTSIQLLAAGLLLAGLAGVAAARDKAKASAAPACGSHGTSVQFEKSPTAAATRAAKEEKLVLVLHVSGHFEDTEFT